MAHRGVRTLVEVSGLAFLGLLLSLAISEGVAAATAHSAHRSTHQEKPFKQRLMALLPARGGGHGGRGDTSHGRAHPASDHHRAVGSGRPQHAIGRSTRHFQWSSGQSTHSAVGQHESPESDSRSESDGYNSARSVYYDTAGTSPARELIDHTGPALPTNDQPAPSQPTRLRLDAVGSDGSTAGTSGGASPPSALGLAASLSGPAGVRARYRHEYHSRLPWNSMRPLVRPG